MLSSSLGFHEMYPCIYSKKGFLQYDNLTKRILSLKGTSTLTTNIAYNAHNMLKRRYFA